jgi:hypothetical protein
MGEQQQKRVRSGDLLNEEGCLLLVQLGDRPGLLDRSKGSGRTTRGPSDLRRDSFSYSASPEGGFSRRSSNLSWKETTLVQERSVVLGVSDVNTVTAQEELVANMVQASPTGVGKLSKLGHLEEVKVVTRSTGVEDVLAAFAASSADLLVNWSSWAAGPFHWPVAGSWCG